MVFRISLPLVLALSVLAGVAPGPFGALTSAARGGAEKIEAPADRGFNGTCADR